MMSAFMRGSACGRSAGDGDAQTRGWARCGRYLWEKQQRFENNRAIREGTYVPGKKDKVFAWVVRLWVWDHCG